MANAFGIPDPISDNCGDPIKPATLDDVINGTATDYGKRDVQFGKRMVHANKACWSKKPYSRMRVTEQKFGVIGSIGPFTEVTRRVKEWVVPKTMGFPTKLDNARTQYGGR